MAGSQRAKFTSTNKRAGDRTIAAAISLGLGPANVKREPLAQAAPRSLTLDQQRELLRAAEASRPRDRAFVTLLLYTALRLHELVALNIDDVNTAIQVHVATLDPKKPALAASYCTRRLGRA